VVTHEHEATTPVNIVRAVRNPRDFRKPLAMGAPEPILEVPLKPSRMIHFFDPGNPRMAAKVPELAGSVDVLLGNLEDAIAADKKEQARAGLVEVGKTADVSDWRVARTIFVCEDDKVAARYARHDANSPYLFYFKQLLAKFRVSGRLAVNANDVAFTGPAEIESSDPKILAAWLESRSESQQNGDRRPMSLRGDLVLSSEKIAVDRLSLEFNRQPLTGRFAYFLPSGNRPARVNADLHPRLRRPLLGVRGEQSAGP